MNLILTEERDRIFYITLNRPNAMNALNTSLLSELESAINHFKSQSDLIGAIITGVGDKAFAAGADIAEFEGCDFEKGKAMGAKGHSIFDAMEQCGKPIIAAVNGYALGGGCELAMACHFIIASENAKFGQPEVNLGLIPGYGGTQRLTRLIGKGRALELLITGDMISAGDAHRMGLANHVVSLDELIPTAEKILQKVAKKAPLAVARCIDAVNAYYDNRDGYQLEIDLFAASMETNDFVEGTKAFLEKRKANFTGT